MQHPSPIAPTDSSKPERRAWGLVVILLVGALGLLVPSGGRASADGTPPDGDGTRRPAVLRTSGVPGGTQAASWLSIVPPVDAEAEPSGNAPPAGIFRRYVRPRRKHLTLVAASSTTPYALARYLLLRVLRI